jgi:hypothetical protein
MGYGYKCVAGNGILVYYHVQPYLNHVVWFRRSPLFMGFIATYYYSTTTTTILSAGTGHLTASSGQTWFYGIRRIRGRAVKAFL